MNAGAFQELFGRMPGLVRDALGDLDEEQLAARLDPEANTIAWLVWHLTRVQDDHVAEAARVLELPEFSRQLYPERYADEFALPFPVKAHGYGHTPEQVAAV